MGLPEEAQMAYTPAVPGAHPLRIGLAAAALLALAGLAHAQGPPAEPAAPKLPEPLTREAIRDLVARLGDAEVRQLLIAQLDRAAAPAPPAPSGDVMGMADAMEGRASQARERGAAMVRGLGVLPAALADARARFLEGRGTGHLALMALGFVVMLAAGFLAERFFGVAVRGLRRSLEADGTGGLGARVGRLALRLVLDLLDVVVFTGGAVLFFFALYQGHQPTRRLFLAYLVALVLTRLVAVASKLLLAPAAPARRLLPFDDASARRLHVGVVRWVAVYAFGGATLRLLASLGVPEPTVRGLSFLLTALLLGLALDTVWRVRRAVGDLIRGDAAAGSPRRLLADWWPLLATAYLAIIFAAHVGQLLSGMPPIAGAGILSVALLVALPILDMALGRVLAALLRGEAPAAVAGFAAGASAFEPVLRKAIHVVVVVIGLLVLADLWSLNLFALAERGLGGRVASALLGIAITLLLAWILWELARTAIDRRLRAEGGGSAAEPGEEGGAAASRLRTLLPLFRGLLLSSIVVMATLSVLAALGVNILPLLAGAGVVGVAIGFGSQTLVRDVVSGAFFLADDAFRLGEYIEAGDSKGTIERIGIRSLHIRHHRGAINVVPYGEIKRLRNNSRDWMIMPLEFRLPYDTDLIKVKKIIRRIGEEIAADPELGRDLLQPLKFQGVMSTDDTGLVVRAKFMAKPTSAPYLIRREAYNRLLKEFAAEGIHFAHRQVTVVSSGAGADAVRGAAAAAGDGNPGAPASPCAGG
jgi:small-conductance mechanosensitive channel